LLLLEETTLAPLSLPLFPAKMAPSRAEAVVDCPEDMTLLKPDHELIILTTAQSRLRNLQLRPKSHERAGNRHVVLKCRLKENPLWKCRNERHSVQET
jgi:hypothetical protein